MESALDKAYKTTFLEVINSTKSFTIYAPPIKLSTAEDIKNCEPIKKSQKIPEPNTIIEHYHYSSAIKQGSSTKTRFLPKIPKNT
jgi:hypothetical protein